MRRSTVLLLCVLCVGVLAANDEQEDSLFSFSGLDTLRGPGCVPESFRLPKRIINIADECLQWVETTFEDLDAPNSEPTGPDDPNNQAHSSDFDPSVRRFQLGMRECMSEKMGIVDDNGEFIEERLVEEITALGFPATFERDVQLASRACLYQTPDNLSVEQRQNFYYVCRDSLLDANCLYKRLALEDPDRALDIGLQQTRCLDSLTPTPTVVAAMDQCKETHNVPVRYATLRRRRRSVEDEEALEGSAEPPVEEYEQPSFEENEQPPVEENEQLSVEEVEQPPVEENEQPPVEENEQLSVEENEQLPIEEVEQPPVEEVEQPPVEENEQLPVEENELPPFEEEGSPDDELSVADRVDLFIQCVYETIGVVQPDGEFNIALLIEELKQFEGDEKAVQVQVDAATRCQDKTTREAYNVCYYEHVSYACHIFQVQEAFLAGDPALLPEY